MAAADAAANAVKGAGNMVTGAFGFVARNIPKVAAVGGLCLVIAALVTPPGAAAGVAAFAGKSSIGMSELGGGVMEGVVEGSGKLAQGASWVAAKVGGAATMVPGATPT